MLQTQVLSHGIQMYRRIYEDIRELISDFPDAKAYFNCTGLGSDYLKGVEDKLLYPTMGCIPVVPLLSLSLTYSRAKLCLSKILESPS